MQPLTQQGFAEPKHPMENDSAWTYWVGLPTVSWLGTSNEPSLAPTKSARACWAWTPQTQQGFAESYSHSDKCTARRLTTRSPYSPMTQRRKWLSGSPHRPLHSPMTQHRKCWVWLTTQASPQPNDSVVEMLSLALHTGLSTAQELRVGNAESGSLRVNYQGTVTQSRRCWVWLYMVYVQKWIWLTCWANWFLAACRLVSLWATNP